MNENKLNFYLKSLKMLREIRNISGEINYLKKILENPEFSDNPDFNFRLGDLFRQQAKFKTVEGKEDCYILDKNFLDDSLDSLLEGMNALDKVEGDLKKLAKKYYDHIEFICAYSMGNDINHYNSFSHNPHVKLILTYLHAIEGDNVNLDEKVRAEHWSKVNEYMGDISSLNLQLGVILAKAAKFEYDFSNDKDIKDLMIINNNEKLFIMPNILLSYYLAKDDKIEDSIEVLEKLYSPLLKSQNEVVKDDGIKIAAENPLFIRKHKYLKQIQGILVKLYKNEMNNAEHNTDKKVLYAKKLDSFGVDDLEMNITLARDYFKKFMEGNNGEVDLDALLKSDTLLESYRHYLKAFNNMCDKSKEESISKEFGDYIDVENCLVYYTLAYIANKKDPVKKHALATELLLVSNKLSDDPLIDLVNNLYRADPSDKNFKYKYNRIKHFSFDPLDLVSNNPFYEIIKNEVRELSGDKK
ncbi:MAG: hypothetical protein ABIG93_05345 [archaeon]